MELTSTSSAHSSARSAESERWKLRSKSAADFAAYFFAAVLLLAVIGKAMSLGELAGEVERLRFLPWPRSRFVPIIPSVEIACVGLLLARPCRRLGLYASLGLLTVFTGYLIFRVFHPDGHSCVCFGGLSRFPFLRDDRVSLARNAILLAIGSLALYLSGRSDRPGDPPPRGSPAQRPHTPSGFTLVELLVAIGIIGILIAMLVPALRMATASSQSVSCQNNLRQFGQLAANWQSAHDGYLPLDGDVQISASAIGSGSLPPALGDPARHRYAYTPDTYPLVPVSYSPPTQESTTPTLIALLQLSDSRFPAFQAKTWSAIESEFATARLMRCPASADRVPSENIWAEGNPSGTLTVGSVSYTSPWRPACDYLTNGALLGFKSEPASTATYRRGHAAHAPNPTQTLLAAEAGSKGFAFAPADSAVPTQAPISLAQALTPDSGRLDFKRHRNRANILFLDGHVDRATDSLASLQTIFLSVP